MSAPGAWSRRRAAVAAEAQAEAAAAAQAEAAAREATLAERDDDEILAELDLPDPDTLGEGDDFKAFLTDAVPARLKTRALRRLWLTNPLLANIDGLVDYGEDFTDAAMAVEHFQTAYQVGKGMTAHVEELARQAAEDETLAAPEGDTAEEQAEDAVALAAQDHPEAAQAVNAVRPPDANVRAHTDSAPHSDAHDPEPDEGEQAELDDGGLDQDMSQPLRPRRMRFSFEQDSAG